MSFAQGKNLGKTGSESLLNFDGINGTEFRQEEHEGHEWQACDKEKFPLHVIHVSPVQNR